MLINSVQCGLILWTNSKNILNVNYIILENAKIVNLALNVFALIDYIMNGKVIFAIGIPASVCAIVGNYLGVYVAIKM